MNKEYIKFLAQESKRDKLVIFVGAGVSKNSGLPSWNQLIDEFAEYLEIEKKENYSAEETLNIPQIFYDKFGKIKYYEILDDVFDNKLFHHEIHDLLKKLNPNHVITTNYDELLETKFNKNSIKYDVISAEEDLAHSQRNKMIIKMHGDLKNKNIVLKKDDYENYEEKFPLITTYIKSLFTTNTVLFIGYSLNDVNVQLIMKWIKEILKEDFRRVYLADFSECNIVSKNSDNNNSLINKIFLNELEENKKCPTENKGELLANFLKTLLDKIKELNSQIGKLFTKLDYIPDSKILKMAKNKNKNLDIRFISYQNDDFSPYLNKELSVKLINKSDKKDEVENFLNFDLNLLLKSNTNKLNGKNIVEFKDVEITKKELENDNNLKKDLLKMLISYDFDKLNNKLQKNKDKYQYLKAYCYYSQNDFSKAQNILEKLLEINSSPELILWSKYNKNLIDQKENLIKRKNAFNLNINLEKEYTNYLNNINTDLYQEITERASLKLYQEKLNKLSFEIKKKKHSINYGYSELEQAQITIKDFLNYTYINGYIVDRFTETKNIYRVYLDIIFYAYKNDVSNVVSNDFFIPGGKINKLYEFNYIDLYIMQQINFKELVTLMSEHNIYNMPLKSEHVSHFIFSFENYLKYFIEEKNNTELKSKLNNFLKILSKLDLSEININEFAKKLLKEDVLKSYNSDSYSLVVKVLNDNLENLSLSVIEGYIIKLLIVENPYFIYKDNYVMGFLSYAYNKKTNKKLDLRCEFEKVGYDLEEYQNIKSEKSVENISKREDLERKLTSLIYLTRVVTDELKNKIITAGKNYLNQEFSIEIYLLMLKLDLINRDPEYEDSILEKLKELIKKDKNLLENNLSFINNIIILNLEEFTSEEFKTLIKKIDKNLFINFLKENNIYNIFQYSLEPENFDFKNFKIDDFNLLTKNGLEDLLKKDQNNDLKILIKKHLTEKYKGDKYLAAFLDSEI